MQRTTPSGLQPSDAAAADRSPPLEPESAARRRGMRTFYFAAFAALGIHAPYFPLWLEAHGFRGVSMSAIAALSPALSMVGPPLVGALSDARGARGNLLGWVCGVACLAMAALAGAEASGHAQSFAVVFGCVLVFSLCRSPILLLADRIALESGADYGRRRALGFDRLLARSERFWALPARARALVAGRRGAGARARLLQQSAPAAHERAPGAARAAPDAAAGSAAAGRALALWFEPVRDEPCQLRPVRFARLSRSRRERDTIGQLWATGVLAEILVLAAASRLFQSGRPERLLVLSYGVGALRWLAMSALPNTELAFLLQPLHGISFGLVWLSSLEVLRRVAEPSALGGAQGALMAANSIGGTLGILVFGPLYAARGAASVFHLATLLARCCAAARGLRPDAPRQLNRQFPSGGCADRPS
jgi:PPP family 3-phenylpropionic acid transporter